MPKPLREIFLLDDGGRVTLTTNFARCRPPYDVRVMDGRLYFNGQRIDDQLDHGDKRYEISGVLSRDAIARLAFDAGYRAGQKSARKGGKR